MFKCLSFGPKQAAAIITKNAPGCLPGASVLLARWATGLNEEKTHESSSGRSQ
jgi:hypothetical protein